MKYIKLNGIGKYGNVFELAVDALDIKYMEAVNEITLIRLTSDEFTVTDSIDEIIEKIEAPSNAIAKLIKKITEDNDSTKSFDINLN